MDLYQLKQFQKALWLIAGYKAIRQPANTAPAGSTLTTSPIPLGFALVDWFTGRQANHGQFTELNDGCVIRIDKNGEIIRTTDVSITERGSHDSSFRIRINSEFAEIAYNPSQWNKPDNVFGLPIESVFPQLNKIMASLGQPNFDQGKVKLITGNAGTEAVQSGLQATTIHYTVNTMTGSPENLSDFMHTMAQTSLPRLKTSRNKNTVYFGKNTGSKTVKVYPKHQQLRDVKFKNNANLGYITDLANDCEKKGVARIELQLGRKFLERSGLRQTSNLNTEILNSIIRKELPLMTENIKKLSIDDIPNGPLGTLKMYQSGIDVKARLSQQTYYKHRAILKKFGYDISVQNVVSINPTIAPRDITIKAYEPPEFYDWGDQEDFLEN